LQTQAAGIAGRPARGYAAPTRSSAFLIQAPVSEEPEVSCIFLDHNKHPDRAPATA
jgi:hypothetical protein